MQTNLLKLLKERNMTQRELAEKTGIRPSTVSDLCNGISVYVKLEHLSKICRILVCNSNDIFNI